MLRGGVGRAFLYLNAVTDHSLRQKECQTRKAKGVAPSLGWHVMLVSLRGEEFQNRVVRSFGLVSEEDMACLRKDHKICARNAGRDQFAVSWRHQPVGLAMDHQRGRRDLGKAAVGLPGEDSLQLGYVRYRAGKPSPAYCQVLVNPLARSARIIQKGQSDFRGFLRTDIAA